MKKNKKLVKKLKARGKKNSLSEKMLGDNVFCLKNTIVKIVRNRAYVKMQGDDPYVKPENISVGTNMDGEHSCVSPNTGDHSFVDMEGNCTHAKMQGEHPPVKSRIIDMNGEHPPVDKK